MKFFHTADWHLGKIVHGVSMIEEQRHMLKQFSHFAEREKPDAIIIAGDIYDRAVPPPEAVQLLNEWIKEVVMKLRIPVLAITGNHDSPYRLDFGTTLMEQTGFVLAAKLEREHKVIELNDVHGEVHVHLIPYADPSIVRNVYEDESIKSFDDAMKKIVSSIKETMSPRARHIFVGHGFITPYGEKQENTSESEKPLMIGGVEYVSSEHFEPFHYVALGHLHQAHYVRKNTIRYAGSPLKYSISEENHEKGFYIVHLGENGEVNVEKKLLEPLRDLRTIEGTMEEILRMEASDDYVFIKLLDPKPILSPMEKVRSVFPNALHLERPFELITSSLERTSFRNKQKLSDIELFQTFYEEVTGNKCDVDTIQVVKDIMEKFVQTENELHIIK